MDPTNATTRNNIEYLKTSEENYYSILGCNQNSTQEELKRNYQALIKRYHPDKQDNTENYELINKRFIVIDKAYKILRDQYLRKQYDASLLMDNFSENSLIYAEISKSELIFNDGISLYPCRCGNNIEVPEEVLHEEECVIECAECTNCILVK